MKRRMFVQGGTASLALVLAACGGGGTGSAAQAVTPERSPRPAPAPAPVAAPAPSPVPSPAPSPAPSPGSDTGYPFGSRKDLVQGRYPFGIAPHGATPASMDASILRCYAAWKAANLQDSPAFTATQGLYAGQVISGGKHVRFNSSYATVSEGMGYAMLITVIMAGADPQARACFEGLLRTARGRPAWGWMQYGRPQAAHLMEWRLASSMDSAGDGWNATDGDLDMALALLMADRQWGSGGAIDYRQEALATIAALKSLNFAPTGEPRGPQRANTRTSDHMIGHFRAFRAATGDAFWDLAIDRCYALDAPITNGFSPVARLQPGFIVDCTTSPIPSPGNLVESPYEGMYDGNAIRNPWRWGTDYVWSGDARWGTLASDISRFLRNDCGGDPFNAAGMYRLDGTPWGSRYFAEGCMGPAMVGCMADAGQQAFLDALWAAHAAHFSTDYYDSELQLLPMIVASGNWWRP